MSILCPTCLTENPDGSLNCLACGFALGSDDGSSSGSPLHLPAGASLKQGRYQVEKTLGEGGFGITYKGIDATRSQPVAIKELFPEKSFRQGTKIVWPNSIAPQVRSQQIMKFKLEAQYLANCQHPNIVKVHDYFEENDTAYVAMDLLSGKSLLDILKSEGPLSEERAKRYFIQITEALGVIHANRLLHRDIKPENILLDDRDRAVLIDFGAAREFIAGQTGNMTAILTPGYAPYEQYAAKTKKYPATDFYALCASMYEMVTGQVPVDATERATSLLQSGNADPLVPPRQLRPDLSPLLEQVILTGLRVNVGDRFQTAAELIDALQGNFISPAHRQAREAIARGDLNAAVQAYDRCLNTEPQNGLVAVESAIVRLHLNDSQAEAMANKAIQLAPNDGRGYGVLGTLFCRRGQWGQAAQQLQKAVSLSPQAAWMRANWAWALGKCNNWNEARSQVDRTLEIDSECSFALGLRAWIALGQKDWKLAIRSGRQALFKAKNKGDRSLENLQHWVYPCIAVGLDKAIVTKTSRDLDRCLQEFSSQVPDSAFAWGFLGWKHAVRGEWNEAIANLERASNQPQAPQWVYLNLGIVRERSQDLQGAVAAYEAANRDFPQHGLTLFRLGTVLGKLGEWQRAISYLEEAVRARSDYAEAYHNLGWVRFNNRPPGGGAEQLRPIISAYRQAVTLYQQQNKFDLAGAIEGEFAAIDFALPS